MSRTSKVEKTALIDFVTEFNQDTITDATNKYAEYQRLRQNRKADYDRWREEARQAVFDFAGRLMADDDVSDLELKRFSIPEPPDPISEYSVDAARKQIDREQKIAKKRLGYAKALKADKDGTVTLSVTDMRFLGFRAD